MPLGRVTSWVSGLVLVPVCTTIALLCTVNHGITLVAAVVGACACSGSAASHMPIEKRVSRRSFFMKGKLQKEGVEKYWEELVIAKGIIR
jgi:hypothetical protein